ncbi:MAG: helix-turn-helix domain-containing protein [Syntrophales bacterium]
MKQDQETLGSYLRREREKRHATVEELALFLGIRRSFVDALEADDLECFPGKADGLRLVRQYTAYLNLDRSEAVRRFEGQWKMSAGLKRYPKLTHYPDDQSPRKRGLLGGRRPFAGVSAAKLAVASALGVLLLAVPVLVSYLPDLQALLMSPAQVAPEPVPPEPAPPHGIVKKAPAPPGERTTPPTAAPSAGVVKKATLPPAERTGPPAASGAAKASPPKRVRAIDPLYTPPGRAERKPVPPPKGGRVVGNRDTKRYHLPGMKYYDKVKEYHRVVFQSERKAIRAGYVKAPH